MHHYKICGLENVYLRNGYDEVDTPYGKAVAIHNIEGLHRAIGKAIVEKPTMTGSELRFLRIEMNLSQSALARLLGVSESSVRNWENDRTQQVPKVASRLVKVLYLEHVDEESELRRLMEDLARLDRELYQLELKMEETDSGWKLAA